MSRRPFSYKHNPLHAWHPKKYETYWYTPRSIQSKGHFVHLANGDYGFIISSPSSKTGFREYSFSIPPEHAELQESTIRGIWGENEARILLKELLRQSTSSTGIEMFRFLKNIEDIPDLSESKYTGSFEQKYNLNITLSKNGRSVTDFDGVLQYRLPNKSHSQEGYIIVEAKTGKLERNIATKLQLDSIKRKVINPIQSIFPDAPVDYFLMGDPDKIYVSSASGRERRELRPELVNFVRVLGDYNIGCIIQPFSHSKESIVSASKDAIFIEKSRRDARVMLDSLHFASTGVYSNETFKIHLVGGTPTGIYRKIGPSTYLEITA